MSSRLEAAALDRPAGPIGLSEHAGAKGLPQGHHPFELDERRIGAGQHEVVGPGLGRQQTIKRISVRHGPQAGLTGYGTAYRQIDRRQTVQGHGVVVDNGSGVLQFSQPPLRGDLPGGGGADNERVIAAQSNTGVSSSSW